MRNASLALALGLTGCFTYPCDTDVLACEDGEALELDPTCEAEGELELVARENESDAPIPADAWPTVHEGAQGLLHFALALQMRGMDPDHQEIEITLRVEACEDEACATTTMITSRTLVADAQVLEVDDDAVELHDIVLVLDEAPPQDGRLVVEALDACGRTASLVVRAGSPAPR